MQTTFSFKKATYYIGAFFLLLLVTIYNAKSAEVVPLEKIHNIGFVKTSQNNVEATVLIRGEDKQKRIYVGAGVIFKSNSGEYDILTAAHIADLNRKTIEFRDGMITDRIQREKIRGIKEDIAILKVKTYEEEPLIELAKRSIDPGSSIYLIGHPMNNTWISSRGILLDQKFRKENKKPQQLFLGKIICKGCTVGDSGGGVYDTNDKLIGIFYATNSKSLPGEEKNSRREEATGIYVPDCIRIGYIIPLTIIKKAIIQSKN